MTEEERLEETRRVARFEAAQKRRVAAHAAKYGWRDGTTEVETAGLLVVIAVVAAVVINVPALQALRGLRVEAVGLLLALLVIVVEVLATGFRYHVSQGVGGLVGRPRVERVHVIAGAVAAVLAFAVLFAAVSAWLDSRAVLLPIGGIAGALGVLGALLGATHGSRRIIIAALATAFVGCAWDRFLGSTVIVGPNGFVFGLLALAVVPLVSGIVAFHQYRREVSEHHDDYVVDAIALLRSPKAAQRAVAAESLGRLGGLEVAEPLVIALGDPDEDVRLAAAFALGEIRELVPARLVARRLDQRGFGPEEPVPPQEMMECAQLARLEWQDTLADCYADLARRPDVLASLKAATAPSQPAPVRRTAARVLGETGEPEAIRHLVRLLTEEHREVHAAARGALAWTGASGARALAPLLADSRDWVRREASAAMLGLVRYAKDADEIRVVQELRDVAVGENGGRFTDAAAEWMQVAAVAQEAFAGVTDDPDEMVREAAARALDLFSEEHAAAR